MDSMPLAEAQARLSELVRLASEGQPTQITLEGQPVAQISGLATFKKPVDMEWLRSLTESQQPQPESAGEFIRWMRDTDRY